MTRSRFGRWLLVTAIATASLSAQAPRFRPPDGHWWLAASQDRRGAFMAGFAECHLYTLGLAYVATTPQFRLVPAITAYYRHQPDAMAAPVATAVDRINERWLHSGRGHWAHDPPRHGYNGVAWVQIGEHDAIVSGFLSCQVAAHRSVPDVPVAAIVARVNALLGIPKDKPWAVDAHGRDRLGPVILKAEAEAAAAAHAARKPQAWP